MKRAIHALRTVLALALAWAANGCFQLEYDIVLRDGDDGATITERFGLTRELLELDARTPAEQKLEKYLTREAVLERMKVMGAGIVLKEHKRIENPDGSLESRAVFEIPDVTALRLPNPLVRDSRMVPSMKLIFSPHRTDGGHPRVHIYMRLAGKGRAPAAPPGATPFDIQYYRELAPAYADMMRGLSVAVRLTVPTDAQGGKEVHPIFVLSDRNTDRGGAPFLQNEEAMVAMLRVDPFSGAIHSHAGAFQTDSGVPVLRHRTWGATRLIIRPTTRMSEKWSKTYAKP
jgi:hypothetical protein